MIWERQAKESMSNYQLFVKFREQKIKNISELEYELSHKFNWEQRTKAYNEFIIEKISQKLGIDEEKYKFCETLKLLLLSLNDKILEMSQDFSQMKIEDIAKYSVLIAKSASDVISLIEKYNEHTSQEASNESLRELISENEEIYLHCKIILDKINNISDFEI